VKQVLITGGAGFIGSHVAEAILAEGHRVTLLDDESTGCPNNLHVIRNHFDCTYVKGSATDRSLVRELLRDVDDVYHLAAAVGVRLIDKEPIDSIERNIQPAQIVLSELCRRQKSGHQVKVFLASSSEVYGNNPKACWTEEDSIVLGPTNQARWSYGASKAIDEFLGLAYWRQHRLPVVVGRLFNVVGPRQTGRYGMVLPRLIDSALAGTPPVVYDDGQQVRCFAHVADVCQAIIRLMDTDAAVGEVFNIGTDRPVTILELAEQVVAAIDPNLDIEFESYRNVYSSDFQDVRSRVPDLSKLKRTIDYHPRHDLNFIIQEVVDWKRG
jgi:UDP-glucose 4-epimerase